MSARILPDTTIGALLEDHPAAESALLEMSPAFSRLRNPLIRRTVAKVATIEQAARMGGVPLATMIARLREAAGVSSDGEPGCAAPVAESDRATWLRAARVVEEVDADAMLKRGVHPIGRIRSSVSKLAPGEAVVLRSSFRPEPLIETMRRSGATVECTAQDGTFVTRFGQAPE